MATYREFHRRSIQDREGFWAEQAGLIHWQRPFQKVLDYSKPPFARWFVGGETNLCHNAIDRHLASRAEQKAAAVPEPSAPPSLPPDIERALQLLEGVDPVRLGKGAKAVLKRLERVAKMIQVKKH